MTRRLATPSLGDLMSIRSCGLWQTSRRVVAVLLEDGRTQRIVTMHPTALALGAFAAWLSESDTHLVAAADIPCLPLVREAARAARLELVVAPAVLVAALREVAALQRAKPSVCAALVGRLSLRPLFLEHLLCLPAQQRLF
jgi:hypothetical protein